MGNYVIHAKLIKIMIYMMIEMKLSNNKDIHQLITKLLKQESIYLSKGKKHNFLMINNRKLAIPSTPSDFRSFQQFKHDVNRFLRRN